MSQNLPQICTATAQVYRKAIPKQIQYRVVLHFVTLSTSFLLAANLEIQERSSDSGKSESDCDLLPVYFSLTIKYTELRTELNSEYVRLRISFSEESEPDIVKILKKKSLIFQDGVGSSFKKFVSKFGVNFSIRQ